MKIIQQTFLILAISVSSCTETPSNNHSNTTTVQQLSSKMGFSQIVFRAIKNNNFEAYSQYFINHKDLDYFLLMKLRRQQKRLKGPSLEKLKQSISNARAQFSVRRKARLSTLKKSFIEFRQQATKIGVLWNTAKFTGAQFENTRHIHKIATADIIVTFTHNNKYFVFRIPRCQLFRRGWIYSEPLQWEGLYK